MAPRPALGRLGIAAWGWRRRFIALILYSLLPIVRNTVAGLDGVPTQAPATPPRGMGMTGQQTFWRVDAWLALPVLLSGVRVTAVQAVGLAAVSALIGAGGLGAIIFQGLFANALDLVVARHAAGDPARDLRGRAVPAADRTRPRGAGRRGMIAFAALVAALVLATFGMPYLRPVFAALFPGVDSPVYQQDSFADLLLGHLEVVAVASAISVVAGLAAGVFVTRPAGREFRGLLETVAAAGQAFPPVAVLALTVPAMGFGFAPAVVALALYGLLPVVQNTLAGLDDAPAEVVAAARGMGMSPAQVLLRVELPLAAPVIIAGIRLSVVIGVGTAAIASTVGARTLGLPIIVGLNGSNTAYVLQGALLVALLAVSLDQAFELLARRLGRCARRLTADGRPGLGTRLIVTNRPIGGGSFP